MKWKHLTITLLAVLLIVGATIAQPPGQGFGRGQGERDGMGPMQKGGSGMCMRSLNLSDDQQATLQKMRLEQQRKMVGLKTEVADLKGKLKLILTNDKFDKKEADRIISEMAKFHQTKMDMHIQHLRKVRDILNDKQKVIFDQKVLSGQMDIFHRGGHKPGMHPGMGQCKPGGRRNSHRR